MEETKDLETETKGVLGKGKDTETKTPLGEETKDLETETKEVLGKGKDTETKTPLGEEKQQQRDLDNEVEEFKSDFEKAIEEQSTVNLEDADNLAKGTKLEAVDKLGNRCYLAKDQEGHTIKITEAVRVNGFETSGSPHYIVEVSEDHPSYGKINYEKTDNEFENIENDFNKEMAIQELVEEVKKYTKVEDADQKQRVEETKDLETDTKGDGKGKGTETKTPLVEEKEHQSELNNPEGKNKYTYEDYKEDLESRELENSRRVHYSSNNSVHTENNIQTAIHSFKAINVGNNGFAMATEEGTASFVIDKEGVGSFRIGTGSETREMTKGEAVKFVMAIDNLRVVMGIDKGLVAEAMKTIAESESGHNEENNANNNPENLGKDDDNSNNAKTLTNETLEGDKDATTNTEISSEILNQSKDNIKNGINIVKEEFYDKNDRPMIRYTYVNDENKELLSEEISKRFESTYKNKVDKLMEHYEAYVSGKIPADEMSAVEKEFRSFGINIDNSKLAQVDGADNVNQIEISSDISRKAEVKVGGEEVTEKGSINSKVLELRGINDSKAASNSTSNPRRINLNMFNNKGQTK